MSEALSGLRQLARRVSLIAARALVRATQPGLRARGTFELLRGELRELELLMPFGLAYRPPNGSEAIVLSIGGTRDHAVAILAHDRRYGIPDLEPGEAALYNLDGSSTVRCALGGVVTVTGAARVVLASPLVRIEGDLEVDGDVKDSVGTMAQMRTQYNAHGHPGGGPPSPPMT